MLWPECHNESYITSDLLRGPWKFATMSCFSPNIRTPLHAHPKHDRFVYVASGDLTVVTDVSQTPMLEGEGRIIPAGVPHGFQSGTQETRILSVFLGFGAGAQGMTTLPEKILSLLNPQKNHYESICTAMVSPELAAHTKGLSEREMETMQWAIHRILTRIEQGKTPSKLPVVPPTKKINVIRGWRKGNTFYLKAPGMALCLAVLRQQDGKDHITINEIQGVSSFGGYERVPRL